MRLDEGMRRIVIDGAEDVADLRAFCESHMGCPASMFDASAGTRALWNAYFNRNEIERSKTDTYAVFMSMVAVALADAHKDAPTVSVEPFKGILADVTSLPTSTANPSRYTFASGRDLWKRLAEAHAVNGNYYVRKQNFDSLLQATEHFWTLAHTRPNESHYLCECKTDEIVASHVNGRTKVVVVEDAVIPAEVCV